MNEIEEEEEEQEETASLAQQIKAVAEIHLHERQWEVFQSKARFRVVVAGRRFGKTHLALTEMMEAARRPGSLVWYVGPNDQQSKRIAWERLKRMSQPFWAKTPNETELRIDLKWGLTLVVIGAFNADSLRGVGLDFLVLDEFAWISAEAWNEVFRPALADRKGRALLIGTPQGRNHFHDHFEYAKTDPDWGAFHFTTAEGGLVDSEELAGAGRQLDAPTYRQEFEGAFTSVGLHRAYYAFAREVHVQSVSFDVLRPLVWSIDFNVNPMCMLLMQRLEDMVHVLQEIVIKPDANTEAGCEAFLKRALPLDAQVPYHQRPLTVKVYGDASGGQRRTSAAATDWALIRQFFQRWVGSFQPEYYTASVNPLVRDRVNCVNSRLRNHAEQSNLLIDPSCQELIKDLDQVMWALDSTGAATSELNKSDKARTHASDALGYFLAQAFPLRAKIGEKSAGRIVG